MGKNTKLAEVAFKGERRAVYRNRHDLDIKKGDYVIVEADRGKSLGRVSLVGNLVRLKRGKGETRSVARKATEEDLSRLEGIGEKESEAYRTCKVKIEEHGLDMKLVDVEVQFDGSKITFYFTAPQRIDFRALVKELASIYRTRIELRQIGVRDEARRVCGFGVCGRKQCCCAFLTEFEQIVTQMAKDQQLSLNPSKISGNCGRLLCCLRYEEEEYKQIFSAFPPLGSHVKIKKKDGTLTYINIFKNAGLVHYEDGSEEWLGPEILAKGKRSDAKK